MKDNLHQLITTSDELNLQDMFQWANWKFYTPLFVNDKALFWQLLLFPIKNNAVNRNTISHVCEATIWWVYCLETTNSGHKKSLSFTGDDDGGERDSININT